LACSGPLAGGELLAIASWRWIFVINVPLAALLRVADRRGDPADAARDRRRQARRLPGALLCALGLGGPVFSADRAAAPGVVEPAVRGR